jgi:KaiC/GvpD/RAD55 family RecA-like ATPase
MPDGATPRDAAAGFVDGALKPNGHAAEWREIELVKFEHIRPRLDGRPLIKGLLEREQTSLIVGESGCGKTFLALDMALHVAAGLEWLGRRVAEGGVVYVAAEAGRSIFNRVAAWKIAHGYDPDEAVIPFATVTSSVDLCHAATGDLDSLIAAINGAGFDNIAFIVIDTVSRALAGGNENAPDDMGAFVRSIDRLRDELHSHVAGVHHLGKDQNKGSRGHSLLHCAVDTEIEVARDTASGISTATVTKQRDGASGDQIAFRLRQIHLGDDADGEAVTSCVVEAAEVASLQRSKPTLPASQKRALELLADAIGRGGEPAPGNDHIPPGMLCVSESLWRQYCYAGQVAKSDKADAKRQAFNRAAEALIAGKHVGKWGDLVWMLGNGA